MENFVKMLIPLFPNCALRSQINAWILFITTQKHLKDACIHWLKEIKAIFMLFHSDVSIIIEVEKLAAFKQGYLNANCMNFVNKSSISQL